MSESTDTQHAPWCVTAPHCFLGCVSRDMHVSADDHSPAAVSARLWQPITRDGVRPAVIEVDPGTLGQLGRRTTITMSLAQVEQFTRILTDLAALAAEGGEPA